MQIFLKVYIFFLNFYFFNLLGAGLLAVGFLAYFKLIPGADVSPLLLVYGFPGTVLGFALKYVDLAPVPLR